MSKKSTIVIVVLVISFIASGLGFATGNIFLDKYPDFISHDNSTDILNNTTNDTTTTDIPYVDSQQSSSSYSTVKQEDTYVSDSSTPVDDSNTSI